jgi:trk system potassium uptake protein TrkH
MFTGILLVVGFFGFLFLEYNNNATLGNLPFGEKILASMFLSVTPRTAGFNTVPTGQLSSSTLFFVIILMFIGASPGSTGGGIKTTTFGVLIMTVWNLITGKSDIEIFKRQLEKRIVYKAIVITMLSLGLVIFVTMILTIIEGKEFMPILFETVSAFGTVGLSTGITAALSEIGKVLIIFTMFVGRVGPLTLAIALADKKQKGVYHYPKEDVTVG